MVVMEVQLQPMELQEPQIVAMVVMLVLLAATLAGAEVQE
jgi:hypothetical protein